MLHTLGSISHLQGKSLLRNYCKTWRLLRNPILELRPFAFFLFISVLFCTSVFVFWLSFAFLFAFCFFVCVSVFVCFFFKFLFFCVFFFKFTFSLFFFNCLRFLFYLRFFFCLRFLFFFCLRFNFFICVSFFLFAFSFLLVFEPSGPPYFSSYETWRTPIRQQDLLT